jgi:hypothetical protein
MPGPANRTALRAEETALASPSLDCDTHDQ